MDIPAAEELEWLESNALLPDEFEEEEEFPVEPGDATAAADPYADESCGAVQLLQEGNHQGLSAVEFLSTRSKRAISLLLNELLVPWIYPRCRSTGRPGRRSTYLQEATLVGGGG